LQNKVKISKKSKQIIDFKDGYYSDNNIHESVNSMPMPTTARKTLTYYNVD